MPNSADYYIKNINRKLVLLTSAIAHIQDRSKRQKYIDLIEEIKDEDLVELEALIKQEDRLSGGAGTTATV